jgi:hypothetical protein
MTKICTRKEPVEFKVLQWTGKNRKEVEEFLGINHICFGANDSVRFRAFNNLIHICEVGEYLVRGDVDGGTNDVFSIAPDVFESKYKVLKPSLKPCPFCGREANFASEDGEHWIICSNPSCGSRPHTGHVGDEFVDVICEKWNKRADNTVCGTWKVRKNIKNAACSECGTPFAHYEIYRYCPQCGVRMAEVADDDI